MSDEPLSQKEKVEGGEYINVEMKPRYVIYEVDFDEVSNWVDIKEVLRHAELHLFFAPDEKIPPRLQKFLKNPQDVY